MYRTRPLYHTRPQKQSLLLQGTQVQASAHRCMLVCLPHAQVTYLPSLEVRYDSSEALYLRKVLDPTSEAHRDILRGSSNPGEHLCNTGLPRWGPHSPADTTGGMRHASSSSNQTLAWSNFEVTTAGKAMDTLVATVWLVCASASHAAELTSARHGM
jgi:hypothetical protein